MTRVVVIGGVVTDLAARSTIPNLFAAGNVADSVQGADRINGSGIMEALVFSAPAPGSRRRTRVSRATDSTGSPDGGVTCGRRWTTCSLKRGRDLGPFVTR
jgi:aspartate oxidase